MQGVDHDPRRHVTVIDYTTSGYVRVNMSANYIGSFRPHELRIVCCTQCGYGYTAHTAEGKCLYGPGNWEE